MMEIWKDIKGYEGKYQVSNLGRVKSYQRNTEKILHPVKNRRGYLTIQLWENYKYKHYQIHRLVYEMFNSTIPEGMQVNHIDENPENNCIENLNIMTPKENINWGTRNERARLSKLNHPNMSKPVIGLQDEKIVLYFSSANEAGRNGFNFKHIVDCCNGKRKTHKNHQWEYQDNFLADWWEWEMEKGA